MEESSYKHNYEYLSIEEAKAIINGTFVQGTTNIGGELATKADIDKLLTAADKKLTSIVPSNVVSNEFVCFFECVDNRVDPTSVTISDITMNVGESRQLSYNVMPANSTIDSVLYEIVSGSDLAHIENSTIYADKEGSVVYKVLINNSITATANITISDTYTYKDVYDINSDLKIRPESDYCGYVFEHNEIGSAKSKYFYINAHRDKIGSKGNIVSSEKINYTFIKDGDVDNFVVNINKQSNSNEGFDEYQIYPKSENSSNTNYELSISIKKEDSDLVFLFNAIHICKDYTKIEYRNDKDRKDFFSSINHYYHVCGMGNKIFTNAIRTNSIVYTTYLFYNDFNPSGANMRQTELSIHDNTYNIHSFGDILQSNNIARGYFTLYLCKYNQGGNIYNYKDETGEGREERTSRHVLNFNFQKKNEKIFSITKDFTAVELNGIEYDGYNPNVIPLERYTKMYDLLFYSCASTMVYKIY